MSPLEAMQLAIEHGRRGAGHVSPNPLVGCVILDRHYNFLAAGYHDKYGGDHAEVAALKQVTDPDALKGAHVFVTLEPCAHEGKTPSCAKTLSTLPIASVTYGLQDPNPFVNGKGAEILRSKGIQVQAFAGLKEELEELPEIFLHNIIYKKPFVALKVAASLDGQMGLKSGESQWITNEHSRLTGHWLRGCYDAILVGSHTVMQDDPRLNVRHPEFPGKRNKVIILDPNGQLLSEIRSRKVYSAHPPEDIYLVVKGPMSSPEVQTIICPLIDSEFDLEHLLKELFSIKINSVYIEGGGQVYSSFLRQHQVQRLYAFIAPMLIGAESGRPWTHAFSVPSLSQAMVLKNPKWQIVAGDAFVTGRLDDSKWEVGRG